MSRVLVVGVAVADYVFYLDAFPTEAAKYRATDAMVVGGGCAANAAVAIARLGGNPLLAARLGQDAVGDGILSDLSDEGVDISLCDRSGTRSSYSSVLVDQTGERQIVNFRGSGLIEDASFFKSAPACGAVLADTRWSDGALAAMELAGRRDVPGVLDIEAPADPDSFKPASHLAFSMQGLASFYPKQSAEDAVKQAQRDFGGWVCVTLGPQGVLYCSDTDYGTVAGFQVETVDTLAAGDIWHGAFALALAEGQAEPQAIYFANAVAALKCMRKGGRAGSPTRAETEIFMDGRTS